MISIRKSLAPKLSFGILLLAVPVFVIALGLLFNKSRQMVREEAVGHANSVLSTTIQRVDCKLGASRPPPMPTTGWWSNTCSPRPAELHQPHCAFQPAYRRLLH